MYNRKQETWFGFCTLKTQVILSNSTGSCVIWD